MPRPSEARPLRIVVTTSASMADGHDIVEIPAAVRDHAGPRPSAALHASRMIVTAEQPSLSTTPEPFSGSPLSVGHDDTTDTKIADPQSATNPVKGRPPDGGDDEAPTAEDVMFDQDEDLRQEMSASQREAEWQANKQWNTAQAARNDSLGIQSAADYFDLQCRTFANNIAMEFVGDPLQTLSYHQLDLKSNQISQWALRHGIRPREVVALMMPNSPQFVITWLGLAKIGCIISCINTRLSGPPLNHALNIAAANHLIVSPALHNQWLDAHLQSATADVKPRVIWSSGVVPDGDDSKGHIAMTDCTEMPTDATDKSLRSHVKLDDPLFYIYTSGTTGPSKAAFFSHRRFIGAGITWSRPMRLTQKDRYYIVLPLYHGNGGVVAISAIWKVGCTAVIREKFSVSNFWKDVQHYRITAMVYIGELWRYLHNQAPCAEESSNPLRVIAGNGLRPDIWTAIVRRFGISRVIEHYGLTEMPAGPYMNCYGRVGACGYIPPAIREQAAADKLVAFDIEANETVKGQDGFLVECLKPGEVGEALFRLATPYSGYTDPRASSRRVYKDAFAKGDMWFATGDLLRRDADGFFYFVDRIGDTFRWKGENVSTNEVCEVLSEFKHVAEANVYGVEVPHRDGKAGMASLVALPGTVIDLPALFKHIQTLPDFARPLFLRISQSEMAKTTTFKFQKVQFQRDGFDPRRVGTDQLLFRDDANKTFVPLTPHLHSQIIDPLFKL